MLTYNTQLKNLKLPEYGRNIQNMVDHCLTIQDRNERTAAAYGVIDAMSNLFPIPANDADGARKYWDHLAVMSDFKLDIDWPVEVISSETIGETPEAVPYDTGIIGMRQYGRNVESMLDMIAGMEAGELRDEMIAMVANQMKKDLLADGNDDVTDEKVIRDIYEITRGRVNLRPGDVTLHEYNVIAPPTKKKKKK